MGSKEAGAAVTELYRTWGPSLLRYAAALTRSPALAEDLVQEAFLALYRELAAGVEVANARAWTLRVVRNLAHNDARGQRRLVMFPDVDLPTVPPPGGFDDLRSLLALLTGREQEVLLLRMASLKYGEIGRELGIAPGTVGALLTRGLAKLRQAACHWQPAERLVRRGQSS